MWCCAMAKKQHVADWTGKHTQTQHTRTHARVLAFCLQFIKRRS